MSTAIRVAAETVKTLNFAAIGAAYMGIGTAFSNPIRLLFVQNLTDAALMFSLDGINDHFPLPALGYMILDVTTNKSLKQGWFIAEGQRVYVKNLAVPTSGDVYVSAFYGAT